MAHTFPARRYTDDQKRAIRDAAAEGIKVPTIVKRAERGQLELDGERLEPFTLHPSSAYDMTRRHARREAKRARELVAIAEPKDTVETLRRRLILVTDAQLARLERKTRTAVDAEDIRKLAVAVRELARIPGPSGETPAPPSKLTRAGTLSESELGRQLLRTGGAIEPVQPETGDTPPVGTGEHVYTPTHDAETHTSEDPETHSEDPHTSEDPGSVEPANTGLMGTLVGVRDARTTDH